MSAGFRGELPCDGALPTAPAEVAACVEAEFAAHRTWHRNPACRSDGAALFLALENDFDADGRATMDELSDAITACVAEACWEQMAVVRVTKLP